MQKSFETEFAGFFDNSAPESEPPKDERGDEIMGVLTDEYSTLLIQYRKIEENKKQLEDELALVTDDSGRKAKLEDEIGQLQAKLDGFWQQADRQQYASKFEKE